jgi:hypothetical protein
MMFITFVCSPSDFFKFLDFSRLYLSSFFLLLLLFRGIETGLARFFSPQQQKKPKMVADFKNKLKIFFILGRGAL